MTIYATYRNVYFICIYLVVLISSISGKQRGHYRCYWTPGPPHDTAADSSGNQDEKPQGTEDRQCTEQDSGTMNNFINQCTGQAFQKPHSCHNNGTWDCQTFFGVCKTLIRTEESKKEQTTETKVTLSETCRRLFLMDTLDSRTNPTDAPKGCPKDPNYFTLKDMSLAVLSSFIAGATMLAFVIFVIWKCRNTKWESEQRKLTLLQKVQSLAALQHIMSMTSGFGRHEVESSHFANPSYTQTMASNAIIEEIIADQDKMYEEILTLKDSSFKKKEDNAIYAKVERRKKADKGIEKVPSDSKLDHLDTISVAEDTDLSNAIGSVADSGYLDESVDTAVNDVAKSSTATVLTIDIADEVQ